MNFNDIEKGMLVGVGKHETFANRTRTKARPARVIRKERNRPDYPDRAWAKKSNKILVRFADEEDIVERWVESREVLGPWDDIKKQMGEQRKAENDAIQRRRDVGARADALSNRLAVFLPDDHISVYRGNGDSVKASLHESQIEALLALLEAKS